MKLIYFLFVIFVSISFLFIQTNSFTKAEISNDVLLAIANEENALIAISYGKGKKFEVKNNTENSIEIVSINLLDSLAHNIHEVGEPDSYLVQPGRVKEFNITGDPKGLTGKTIKINFRWNGGSAEIKSTIPDITG
ncbi:hypothetical protein V7111_10935 [Neobacillus niacini]|uniref:hypothetical protein n=1 Tax=Neobacillus niacini TaxID=86668 RepID=UPI0030005334